MAVVGAGGIGFDVAEFLVTAPGHSPTMNLHEWLAEWGVADPASAYGGVVRPQPAPAARQVTLLQRKSGKQEPLRELLEPLRELLEPLRQAGLKTHLIGGADAAAELDAKRAIDQGTRLAARL